MARHLTATDSEHLSSHTNVIGNGSENESNDNTTKRETEQIQNKEASTGVDPIGT